MKKYLILSLCLLSLYSCTKDNKDKPRLELLSISLNGGDEDYSNRLNEFLPLSPREYIDVTFGLSGDGTDLRTFILKNKDTNFNATLFFEVDDISDEFTDLSEGVLGYVDNVRDTWVTVKLKVKAAKHAKDTISFYLSSKAHDSEGAVYYLYLETTPEPREIVNE